jgi:SPP1 gp7 family putative phage head morphogenesis protein
MATPIKFPEPAQQLYVDRVDEFLNEIDQFVAERLAQIGLRLDQQNTPSPTEAQGAIQTAAKIVDQGDHSSIAAEVIDLAEQFNDEQVDRSIKEAGAQFAVQPQVSDDVRQTFKRRLEIQIGGDLKEHLDFVEKEIVNGVKEGLRAESLASKFEKRMEMGRRKAELSARDILGRFNAVQSRSKMESLGVTQYRWMTAGDERVRDVHAALDGSIQNWNQPPLPGHPGEDWMCRCESIPIFK